MPMVQNNYHLDTEWFNHKAVLYNRRNYHFNRELPSHKSINLPDRRFSSTFTKQCFSSYIESK